MNLDGRKVRICTMDDLIAMKRKVGRHKDLADIEQLSKINSYDKSNKPK